MLQMVDLVKTYGDGAAVRAVDGINLKDRAQELLQKVDMEKRLHHLPGQLSGGEQQRRAIARDLINACASIFVDYSEILIQLPSRRL
ncbi:MAG: hypothetical protein PHQ40_12665 [Anaerolineaceae bacterium]|nr:hypothetical protein [Anaerolineaceae bacterium]